jgi:stearoyl-CoA desaturase (delta-9 desaturase)
MFVNSLLHMTPDLPEGTDSSRNIWWLGPLQFGAWGENWHKNHHSDANAARLGRRWWQVDIGWYVICGLNGLGLARNIRPTKQQLMARVAASALRKRVIRHLSRRQGHLTPRSRPAN